MHDDDDVDGDHDQLFPNGVGSEDDDLDDAHGDDLRDDDVEEGEMDGGQPTSEGDLRQAWDDARETVRLLEGNPRSSPSVLAAARRQRDGAEAAWRAAKPPHPLHKRLRWAQRAYDNAVAKQQMHQTELDQFEEETAKRRRQLLDRSQVDKARTAKKLGALEELLDQGQRERRQPLASVWAAQACATGIDSDVGPALAAVADKLEEGSPAWLELQAAMASLANVEEELRTAATADQRRGAHSPPPAQFDISGDATVASGTTASSCGEGSPNVSASSPPNGDKAAAPPSAAQPVPTPKWVGPQPGSNRWGGREWRRLEPMALAGAATDGQLAHGSSAHAKEQAARMLADQRANLEAAQVRERASAEAARLQAEELARTQQLQEEQQRRAEADARAAAETLRVARQAVAEAEALEAARLEQERMLLVARTSPEDLRRAQEVHAQQAALIQQQQQHHAQQQHQHQTGAAPLGPVAGATTGIDADAERLMAMSDEELQRWNEETQYSNWG